MTNDFALLRQLTLGRNTRSVRVRVSRLWATHILDKATNKHEFIGYDILLLDEEGLQLLATINKRICNKFIPHLEEGGVYSITNFDMKNDKANYRVVDSDVAVHFLQTTVVSPTVYEGFTIPLYRFALVPFLHLHERMGSITNLTDIIGRLYASTPIDMVGLESSLKRRRINLENSSGERIEIALLGDKEELITASDLSGTLILVVTSVLIKTYNGAMSISSTTGTRIFRNPYIPKESPPLTLVCQIC